jgi:hypothetical protein
MILFRKLARYTRAFARMSTIREAGAKLPPTVEKE